MRCHEAAAVAVLGLLAAASAGNAQQAGLGVALRNYDFLRLADRPGDESARHDTEFISLRLMPKLVAGDAFRLEAHLVFDLVSPGSSPATAAVAGRTDTYLPLDRELSRTDDLVLTGYADRLNLHVRTAVAELAVGRQAITWGVGVFWPALDLFAPFGPARIDRDYKPGVDAARLTVPLGSHSELQVVGAVLGDSARRDRAGAALLRINAGRIDFGIMAGSFHGDTVAGGFVTADMAGTLLRGELSLTRVGDEADRLRLASFWRGGVGVERQVTPALNVVVEVTGNGYGAADASSYPAILASDRVRRGEVAALGRWSAGTLLTWQFHSLGTLTGTVLLNLDDGSMAWLPRLAWSLSGDSELLAGALLATGPRPDAGGIPRSEYGSQASRVLAGLKLFL